MAFEIIAVPHFYATDFCVLALEVLAFLAAVYLYFYLKHQEKFK